MSVHLLKDQVKALKCQQNFINTLLIKLKKEKQEAKENMKAKTKQM
jgi:hypothetical protein